MRSWRLVKSILVLAVLMVSCGKSDGSSGSGGSITVHGSVPAPSSSSSAPSTHALVAADVKKVIAFSTEGAHWVADVAGDGSFSIEVDAGAPIGLVFAGASDECLGFLALQGGLDALPLQALSDGTSSVSLGTLAAQAQDCGALLSDADLSSTIPLTETERQALAYAEGFFASVVHAPDADGDGRIDVLQDRYYRPWVMYFVDGGFSFDGSMKAVPRPLAEITSYRFQVSVFDAAGGFPETVGVTAPSGSTFTSTRSDAGSHQIYYSDAFSGAPAVPEAGVYRVAYGARTLTFDLPDQSTATRDIALSVPRITLNGDGTINAIDWEYRLGGTGAETVDPASLIHDLIVQIEGVSGSGRLYDSPNLTADTTRHLLTDQSIRWANVWVIYMAYNDVYGNHVVVSWFRDGRE